MAISRATAGRSAVVGGMTVLMVGGLSLAAAAPASADNHNRVVGNNSLMKISAPKTVTAGQDFTLGCKVKKNIREGWVGQRAVVKEKGVPIHASRRVASNGSCKMHLVLQQTGNVKLRVVVKGPQNVLKSKWISVKVNAA